MNDQQAQCIQLAEVMGWKLVDHCNVKRWIAPDDLGFEGYLELPFYPLTDANDDYAVLEWMRKNHYPHNVNPNQPMRMANEADKLMGLNQFVYKIGDYARAALKVLND